MVDPVRDLRRALDRVAFAADCGISDPDPWQRALLGGDHRRVLLNIHRQGGKSTISGLIGLHSCLYEAPCLAVALAPALRQSTELIRTVKALHGRLDDAPELSLESLTRVEFANGSRFIALPGAERTIRGLSGVGVLILDEAARVPDELIAAAGPMQATVRDARKFGLSTPAGRRGWFFREWHDGGGWHRVKITGPECARIAPEFLEAERRELGELQYRQEYLGEFIDDGESVFASELVEACFSHDVRPLFAAA